MFEFDITKSNFNKAKHGIDFIEAQALWMDSDLIEIEAKQTDELRMMAIGKIKEKSWSAIIVRRNGKIRLISVRRARKEEERLYESQRIG
jgi:uncharacterized protein